MSAVSQPSLPTRLTVIILNYRTGKLTIDCLRSLVDEVAALPQTQVIIVDNNSGDGSVEQIQTAITAEAWESWVKLMPLDCNGGYAFGNNAAIRAAQAATPPPDYVLLLNPDTYIRPGAFRALVQFMDAHPKVGIAGSRLEDPDGTPQRSAFRFPTVLSEVESGLRLGLVTQLLSQWVVAPPAPETDGPTDWVAGASMIIRRKVFESVGLMDEKYFLYYEEVDFCLAAQRAGWLCWYVPESRVVHYVGQSSGVTDTKREPQRRPTYWFNSRRRFFVKNYGFGYALLSELAWASSFALWRVRRAIQGKPDEDPPQLLNDFIANSALLKGGQL